ncbi:MAG TPA: aldo/keto reductase [Armatimonadota bacterium]|nr:aldo/keto reductase [Armatimonadota bacterium]
MRTRKLGRTDLEISEIIFGGIPILQYTLDKAASVLNAALDEGINTFDTARGYGDSEVKMGEVLSKVDCTITSKSTKTDAEGMTADLDLTLQNLKRDHVDVYAMHQVFTPDDLEKALGPDGSCEALIKAKEQGKIRHIAITGHNRDTLIAAIEQAGDVIESCMFLFNPMETDALDRLVPLCVERGVGLVGMKIPGGGTFTSEQALASAKWCLNQPITCCNIGFATEEEIRATARIGRESLDMSEADEAAVQSIRDDWENRYCRRCGACAPCPKGINIVGTLVGESMVKRLGWGVLDGRSFLDNIRLANDCDACGECIGNCPWSLNVPELLPDAVKAIEDLA